jgi:antitoxin component YwqK of YwqJK toxin-antitoxin module
MLASCGKSATSAGEGDLLGYEIENIPGSTAQLAIKREEDRKVQEGYVLNGKKHGMWIDYAVDGRISGIQHYIDGQLHGPSFTMDNRSQITSLASYKNNELDGVKANYKFGRPQEEIPYVQGKIHGVMKKYYSNNKLMEEAEYKNNVQDGFYRHYNEAGVMDLEYEYKNGEKVSGGIVAPPDTQ